jgi:hypothetical protein
LKSRKGKAIQENIKMRWLGRKRGIGDIREKEKIGGIGDIGEIG